MKKPSAHFEKILDVLFALDGINYAIQLSNGPNKFETYEYLKDTDWYEKDLSPYFEDQFIDFGGESDGSLYCLWYYPGLVGEPPVVYIGGDGNNCTIAPSIEDLISLMIYREPYEFNTEPNEIWGEITIELDDYLEILKEDEPETYQEILQMKQIASEAFPIRDYETIIKDFEKHPKFNEFVEKLQEKEKELLG